MNTKKQIDHNKTILFLSVIVLGFIGILIRIPGLNRVGGDMVECLIPWYDSIAPTNGIYSLRNYTGNYGMPYVTILWFLHFFPGQTHIKIKAVSIIFEYICAVSVGLLSSHFFQGHKKTIAFICGFGLTLFYPVLIINGAWWGQCDAIYSSFVILAIYAFFKDKPVLASIFLGCALAFKFQAIFIIPFVILLYYFRRRFSVINLILVPITVEILYIPAIIAGYSPLSPITIYADQAGYYPEMYMYYPGLWSFFWRWSDYERFHIPAISIVIMAYALIFLILLRRRNDLNDRNWMEIAFLTSLIGVYFLPAMHERYGIIAELIAIIYAIIHPKRSWTSLFLWASITWTVMQPMFLGRWPEHKKCAMGLLIIIISLITFFIYDLRTDNTEISYSGHYKFRSEKISAPETKLLVFLDKYAFIPAYIIVFILFVYSGRSVISVTLPDYLSDLGFSVNNVHTPLYFLYIRLLNLISSAIGTNTYLILAISSMGAAILSSLIWTGVLLLRNKNLDLSFPLAYILMPATLLYSHIGKYQDGIAFLLIGIAMIIYYTPNSDQKKKSIPFIMGILFGIAASLLPYSAILIIGLLLTDHFEGKGFDTKHITLLILTVISAIVMLAFIGPVIGMSVSESFKSLVLSFSTNGALLTPLCLFLLIKANKNDKFIPVLLLTGYISLINFGLYMHIVDSFLWF